MIEKLRFYTRHSLNDLRVNGRRTLFALLCIAAGVASIVSLQTLGLMIEDALTGSLQEINRGDIRVSTANFYDDEEEGSRSDDQEVLRGQAAGVLGKGKVYGDTYITIEPVPGLDQPSGLEQIQDWFERNYDGEVTLTYRQPLNSVDAGQALSAPEKDTNKTFIQPYFIEGAQYPFYGERYTEDGELLSEVLTGPNDIVISRNLADEMDVEVGDILRLSGASEDFTITGIVETDEESGYENILGALLGYYYIDVSAVGLFDSIDPGAETIYVKLEGNPDIDEVDALGEALERRFSYLNTTTTADLEEMNSQVSDAINKLVIVMGLISLLIGGIGIVNTMLVVVSRRTTEVAVLKTIGLEGDQVTVLFLVEAILMGVFGSLIGIVLGWIAAYVIKGGAESFLAQSLTFRITPLPAITGLIVGVIVTAIFGFLPTLAAGQVRPNLVLRPSDTVIPKAGRARSFVALLFVMLSLSLVTQVLTRDLLSGSVLRNSAMGAGAFLGLLMALTMIAGGLFARWARRNLFTRILRWGLFLALIPAAGAVYGYAVPALLILFGAFITVGVLYVVLWVLIWLVGRFFPSWRLVDLRIALRSMLAAKGRNASTLMALVIGVFTLSLITMLTTAITNRFEELLVDEVGGNVVVFASGMFSTLDEVEQRLSETEGVNSYSMMGTYELELVEAYDKSAERTLSYSVLESRVRNADNEYVDPDALEWRLGSADARDVTSNLPDVTFYKGRQLNESDTGPWNPDEGVYPPIVISADEAIVATELDIGDLLTFKITGSGRGDYGKVPPQVTFEIVGMVDRRGPQVSINFGSANYAPRSGFPEGELPDQISAIVDVDEDQIGALRRSLSKIPGVFVLETRLLNDLLNSVIEQFTSFPILVAALALVVGGIVIANSVALSTLERRREIAIMKSIGLQRERVLGMLLLEYGVMGCIGGLIGVGLGGLGLLFLLIQAFGGELGRSIPYMTALTLMGLCVMIALVAAIVTAWGASGEKPLNVLRYE
ncbi:MAG: FtsX-like permease family protein [Anaerolineae bacterium]|nr:FtsX-like permease family protein [Anaerolineae bacterium]